MPNPYTWVHEERLSRVPDEYFRLMRDEVAELSLVDFFNHDEFNVDTYCARFFPNPSGRAAAEAIALFTARFALDPDALCRGTHDVSAYMYPTATPHRLVTIGQLIAADHAFTAMMGRVHLPCDGRRIRAAILARMNVAVAAPLAEIRRQAPIGWFLRFLDCWGRHVGLIRERRDCCTLGSVPTVTEYLYEREMTGGTDFRIELIEFANDDFLDWVVVRAAGLDGPVTRVRRLAGVIAGVGSDAYSFERDCIDDTSDRNLVLIHLLNDPSLTLRAAIDAAAATTRGLLAEFLALDHEIGAALERPDLADTALTRTVADVLSGLRGHLRTTWVWQSRNTGRSRRSRSVFRELRPLHAPGATTRREVSDAVTLRWAET